jgi:hypothetical protein
MATVAVPGHSRGGRSGRSSHLPWSLRARLLTPWQARLRGPWLDRELAAGAPPWCTPVHSVRSLQITGTRARHAQARAVEALIDRAAVPVPVTTSSAMITARLLSAQIPVDRAAVLGVRGPLEAIITRLRDGRPISTRGVAALRDLISDGAGPIYSPLSGATLGRVLDSIRDSLDVPD